MKTAIIGLGIMGSAIARRLLGSHADVVVYNRTRSKASELLDQGASWAESPAQAASESDIVITLVTDPDAVSAVVNGPDGILSGLPAASLHCDMSTVAPAWSAKLATQYEAAGKRFIQAPVLGSKAQIESGTLLVLAGGDDADIEHCRSILGLVSTQIWSLGTQEQAATTKLACNMMIAQMILGLGQSMLFTKRSGVDPKVFLDIIQSSNLASAMYGGKGQSMLNHLFAANFVVDNMLKDLNLATEEGIRSKMPLPFASLARDMFVSASASGYGGEDYSAVVKVLESLSGLTL